MINIKADFPSKLQFLFRPYRYKVARGGRGSAKSWGFARALLILGTKKRLRILCAREVQLSIKQSVHKLLKDQIELLGLQSFYNPLETEIRGLNGTEINFTGLSTLTVDTIKSFEGVDICWVEEGQVISKRSWDILIPTIRKAASEIWITYNPDLESDETHQRFTIKQPDNCINVIMNWRDNPWFNDVLQAERQKCLKDDPDNYDHIWEGKCRPAVEGAIYFKQMMEMEAQGRICRVTYDPLLKVHLVFDLGGGGGGSDLMAIGLIQKHLSELRIINYFQDSHRTLYDYSQNLKELNLNWGRVFLPWDGYPKDYKTGQSSETILKTLSWNVVPKEEIINVSVEEGIRITQLKFSQLYIDKDNCPDLIQALKRYRRHMNQQTESFTNPVHDRYSHAADMLRGLCTNADNMENEELVSYRNNIPNLNLLQPQSGGWMVS